MSKMGQQQKYKAHIAYGHENPEAACAAIVAIRPWEQNQTTLVHAVAMAIKDAHERGARGQPLPEADFEKYFGKPKNETNPITSSVDQRIRRTRPADPHNARDAEDADDDTVNTRRRMVRTPVVPDEPVPSRVIRRTPGIATTSVESAPPASRRVIRGR